MTNLSLLEELGRESDLRNDAERRLFNEIIRDINLRKMSGELSPELKAKLILLSKQAHEYGSIWGYQVLTTLSY